MKSFKMIFIIIVLVGGFTLAGCSFTSSGDTPTALPTLVQETPTLFVLASPTAIVVPATPTMTPIPVTPTPSPTLPPPTLVPVRFNFPAGYTSGSVKGTIQPGQTQNILFGAGAGQLTFVTADSPNKDVTIGITGADGQILVSPSQMWTSWKGYLPSTQDYNVQVIGGASTENFEVTFVIPVRISFAKGATSGGVAGTLAPYQVQSYVVNAGGGVPMLVNSGNANTTIAIFGASDGTTLVPAWSATKGLPGWQGTLPSSQDYVVQVIAPASSQNFSLVVSIPARISFASGATSATRSGSTVNGNVVSYVAWGAAGQTMDLTLTSSDGSAVLVAYGFQTGQWMVTYNQKKTFYTTTLPASQDYIIVVDPTKGTVVNYTLTVSIH
jgi:hypothetical protein